MTGVTVSMQSAMSVSIHDDKHTRMNLRYDVWRNTSVLLPQHRVTDEVTDEGRFIFCRFCVKCLNVHGCVCVVYMTDIIMYEQL